MAASLSAIRAELREVAEPDRVAPMLRYFRTGPGEYGEGDRFIGVRVPACRAVARTNRDLRLKAALNLLGSGIHEERLLALLLMVDRYKRHPQERLEVYRAYLANTDRINNWDLVDLSCRDIVGVHLLERPRTPLYELAHSDSLWERRIAIVSTSAFIREDDLDDTFAISRLLLRDREDLIHKACGWMLREAGKRDESRMVAFIEQLAPEMPRTTLRYAIERLPRSERQRLMAI